MASGNTGRITNKKKIRSNIMIKVLCSTEEARESECKVLGKTLQPSDGHHIFYYRLERKE